MKRTKMRNLVNKINQSYKNNQKYKIEVRTWLITETILVNREMKS